MTATEEEKVQIEVDSASNRWVFGGDSEEGGLRAGSIKRSKVVAVEVTATEEDSNR